MPRLDPDEDPSKPSEDGRLLLETQSLEIPRLDREASTPCEECVIDATLSVEAQRFEMARLDSEAAKPSEDGKLLPETQSLEIPKLDRDTIEASEDTTDETLLVDSHRFDMPRLAWLED